MTGREQQRRPARAGKKLLPYKGHTPKGIKRGGPIRMVSGGPSWPNLSRSNRQDEEAGEPALPAARSVPALTIIVFVNYWAIL